MSHLQSRLLPALVALSSIPLLVLTGCGAATSFSNPAASSMVKGKIYGGQQPVTGSVVTVWASGVTGYGSEAIPLASTTSLDDGSFSFPENAYTCPTDTTQVYITAAGGSAVTGLENNPNIMLATGLGNCSAAHTAVVQINEVSTAATAFALAQFFTPTLGSLSTDSFGTNPADLTAFTLSNSSTIPTLIDVPTGTVKPSTENITIEAAKIYSIANILASCVNDGAGFANCNTLFTDTTNNVRGSITPSDTLQAAVQMARFPYRNIKGLYQLASSKPPFVGLATQPNDWTIGVSYTTSALGLSIAGTATSSASIDIDAAGRIWLPSNLSGANGLANFDPTTATFNGPYFGQYVTSPQYVAVDSSNNVYISDQASAKLLDINATTLSGSIYTVPAAANLGPIAVDSDGVAAFAFVNTSGAPKQGYIYNKALGVQSQSFTSIATGLISLEDDATSYSPFGATETTDQLCLLEGLGTVYAQSSTCTASGGIAATSDVNDILSSATSLNQLCSADYVGCGESNFFFGDNSTNVFSLPEGIATDGYGNDWIANSGNASVFTLGTLNFDTGNYAQISPIPYFHDSNNGNTMTAPYAIAIDGSGNVWLANAGCVNNSAAVCVPGPFVLSELIGAAGPTITPLAAQTEAFGSSIGVRPGDPVFPPVSQSRGTTHSMLKQPRSTMSVAPKGEATTAPSVFIR